jgi:HK97 gp10 family phage protein
MAGRAFVKGLNVVIKNMDNVPDNIIRDVEGAAKTALDLLEKKLTEHVNLTCHSLEDLAKYEGHPHPYSTRYKGEVGPHPDDFLHRQSGNLLANIEKKLTANKTTKHVIFGVGINEKKVKYIRHLTYGTSRMRPRDPLGNVWKDNKADVLRIIKYGLEASVGSRRGRTGR